MLLATRVKFFVSVHEAFSIVNVAFFTDNWDSSNSCPLYQRTSAKGLLSIVRDNMTFSLSFTKVLCLSIISGLSKKKTKTLLFTVFNPHPLSIPLKDKFNKSSCVDKTIRYLRKIGSTTINYIQVKGSSHPCTGTTFLLNLIYLLILHYIHHGKVYSYFVKYMDNINKGLKLVWSHICPKF